MYLTVIVTYFGDYKNPDLVNLNVVSSGNCWALHNIWTFIINLDNLFLPDALNAVLHAAGDLHQPALLMSFSKRSLIHLHTKTDSMTLTHRTSLTLAQQSVLTGNDLCNHANAAGDDGSFSLSAAHAPQPRGHKDTPTQVVRAQVPPACVQHGQLHRQGNSFETHS